MKLSAIFNDTLVCAPRYTDDVTSNLGNVVENAKDSGILFNPPGRGILSYFDHRQNYRYIEGNLKIILYKDKKNTKE